jgi:mannose-6-phosphate isomerase-like protein (cupin superfamily)
MQGKVWGETTQFFQTDTVEAHFLKIKKGGFCSEHKHDHKSNLFFVISGKLMITIWRDGSEDLTVLGPGQASAVAPGFYHKFEALEDCKCIEIYRVFLQPPDIDRRTVGGMKK